MSKMLLKLSFFGAAVAIPLGVVAAQGWSPGQELVGRTVQVQTKGIVNSVLFGADGRATITTPQGTAVQGSWSVTNNTLCLTARGSQECWPYLEPFRPGVQVALTSSCEQVTTFMPGALNPLQAAEGERG